MLYRLFADFERYWKLVDGTGDARIPILPTLLAELRARAHLGIPEEDEGAVDREDAAGASVNDGDSSSDGEGSRSDDLHSDASQSSSSSRSGRRAAACDRVSQRAAFSAEEPRTGLPMRQYEHLRQIFVTKSRGLRSEVLKQFRALQRGLARKVLNRGTGTRDVSYPFPVSDNDPLSVDDPVPDSLRPSNLPRWRFPLILTTEDLLLLLDRTLTGRSFFQGSGPMPGNVRVSGTMQGRVLSPEAQSDVGDNSGSDDDNSGSDNDDRFEEALADDASASGLSRFESMSDAGSTRSAATSASRRRRPGADARWGAYDGGKVTFEVFSGALWSKVSRTDPEIFASLSPSSVWHEIRGLIKGSTAALDTPRGAISLDEYLLLSSKQCPHSNAVRRAIYRGYEAYERAKKLRRAFDDADFVFDLHRRLMNHGYAGVTFHRMYIDECQDHTLAEMQLLLLLCVDGNGLFITGDSAQNIEKGVAFRFRDVERIFFTLGERVSSPEGRRAAVSNWAALVAARCPIAKPYRDELRHNYRQGDGQRNVLHAHEDVTSGSSASSLDPTMASLVWLHRLLPLCKLYFPSLSTASSSTLVSWKGLSRCLL